ncbi:MAG: hypothetical protein HPY55_12385 [Firmicutes bacterium]|nr:hypothetical protein [Bacillota bacterium]
MIAALERLGLRDEVRSAAREALDYVEPLCGRLDATALGNTRRVLEAFRDTRVSETNLCPSTGYGYGDAGREALDRVYALVFGAEKALVRLQFVSGTHAVACALLAAAVPGSELLSLTGPVYRTLHDTIHGTRDGSAHGGYVAPAKPTAAPALTGGLRDYGITYRELDLTRLDRPWEAVREALSRGTRTVYIQKSRGYSDRVALSTETIGRIAREVKAHSPSCAVVVDNCYGEFVEEREPASVGADLVAGSLIKNPGGGLARTGGYVAGRASFVDAAAARLTAPGLGGEVGATLGLNREFFHGLFLAPHTVCESLKGAVFCARLFENLGFQVSPLAREPRYDLVQAVRLGSPQRLSAFCGAIQAWSPVDSHVTPEPWRMPGYDHDVIMAAGTFTQGSSIELSADGPFEEPYWAYLQGGLSKEHVMIAALKAAGAVLDATKEA